ncbi:MAG TPA: hypothetical protein VNP72_08140 [Longimicrobium sp.]|nr:hypothetical protein [Longimicrobium sp.]
MSNGTSSSPGREPSPAREMRDDGTYRACFYPGFVRRLAVRRGGKETVLYEQDRPFNLPAGADRPFPTSVVEFDGGPDGRSFALQIHDPHQDIDRILVRLKPRSTEADDTGEDEEVEILDTPILCPPFCDEF